MLESIGSRCTKIVQCGATARIFGCAICQTKGKTYMMSYFCWILITCARSRWALTPVLQQQQIWRKNTSLSRICGKLSKSSMSLGVQQGIQKGKAGTHAGKWLLSILSQHPMTSFAVFILLYCSKLYWSVAAWFPYNTRGVIWSDN